MKGRTQRDFRVLGGQRLAFQRKGILDAGHADAEVVVAAHGAGSGLISKSLRNG